MQPGTRLGDRYALTELVGAGVHTDVWNAHDPIRDRPVRVKALNPALSGDAETRFRFRRSTLEVAALDVPGVVDVIECADHYDPDGVLTVCQITEPIPGTPLSRMLSGGLGLGPEEILSLVAAAAWAVHEAREAGVRHLNLKPANLFVTGDTITVADFGYLPIPEVGPYTAWEQRGGAEPGNTADVFALGAIAYECLTGAIPDGTDPAAALPADTPPKVAALLERALARDPGVRFASAGALATECEQINHTNDVLGALLARQRPLPDAAAEDPAPIAAAPGPGPAVTRAVPVEPPPRTDAVPVTAPAAYPAGKPVVRRPAAAATPASKPRRNRVAVLAAVAVAFIAAVIVGVAMLLPDQPSGSSASDGEHPGYVEPSTTESVSATKSPTPSESSHDDASSGSSATGSSSAQDSETPRPLKTDGPTSSRPAAKVKVPDVVGDSRSEAVDTLHGAGLKSKVVTSGEGEFECAVYEQDPEAGTSVAKGTTVTVKLRLAATEADCGSGGDEGQTTPTSSTQPVAMGIRSGR